MTVTTLKVYHYPNCSTCKSALKYLAARKIDHEKIHIVDEPPSIEMLRKALVQIKADGGTLKQLFNTSGVAYKEQNLAHKLDSMTEDEALHLLATNGKLIKRPFVVAPKFSLTGFKQETWDKKIS